MANSSAVKIIRNTWNSSDATREWLKSKENFGESGETLLNRKLTEPDTVKHSLLAVQKLLSPGLMSKYLKQAEKVSIPRHRHCIVCAIPIGMDREFCGVNCEDEFKRAERKRKYMMLIPIFIIFPFFLLLLFFAHH